MGFGRYRFRRSFGQVKAQFRGARPKFYPLFTGLLDTYAGAAAAYSLRRLSKIASSVVRVRRSSDNAEADFKAKEVSDGTLTDWVAEEQVGWNLQPTWDVSSGDGVISSQSSTATTSTFSITTTSGASFIRQSSKPNHIIASSGDQVVVNITLSGFDGSFLARLRTSGTNTNVAQQTLSNGTADYTFTVTGSAGYFVFSGVEATSGATLTVNSIKVIGQSGFVSKWYDQSGNGNDAVQQVSGNQPKIVDAGSLVTGGLDFDGSNDGLSVSGQVLTSSSFYAASVMQHATGVSTASGQNVFGQYQISASGRFQLSANNSNQYSFFANATDSIVGFNTGAIGTSQTLISVNADESNAEIWRDGTSKATDTYSGFTPATVDFTIGNDSDGEREFNGKIAEIIVYPSDQSANRAAIETDINDHYDIYA
jgi:hypothetical protein